MKILGAGRWLLLFTALFVNIGVAHADALQEDAGYYWCKPGECVLDGSAVMNAATHDFIVYEVNNYVTQWITKDGTPRTVTLCNGAGCETFRYVKLSSTFTLKSVEKPLKPHSYTNPGPTGGAGVGGGGITGGGGTGSGGGTVTNPPSGCFGNCIHPVVTVGDPEQDP